MKQVEELIQYCKLLKYLRTGKEGGYRIAYRRRILSTDNIEIIFGIGDIEWYKIYTDNSGNSYFVSVGLINAIKL